MPATEARLRIPRPVKSGTASTKHGHEKHARLVPYPQPRHTEHPHTILAQQPIPLPHPVLNHRTMGCMSSTPTTGLGDNEPARFSGQPATGHTSSHGGAYAMGGPGAAAGTPYGGHGGSYGGDYGGGGGGDGGGGGGC
ncbi:uncharacterized protein M421DRAFT_7028 [Didymella exigua CBS 183.55]|uniref:Uncharacterized protein n=1 Tax=Didymella exigua CBS 183.55 TaxID=1150837 RepID=A0A6A5RG07_9PLEO|nr:uncharacterized protein M421DRAFT_7028 [Didymella exigua CBS 183.55]KAF1926419.1 hypothetical protein M421DRAFT_7028 [Didymella exigua CBS 183.55]